MGGFKLPQRTAKLVFKDPQFEGAEVRVVLDHPLGMLIEAQKLQEDKDIEGLCRFFATILLDWNLEDKDDQPIPATEEGLRQVTASFINALIDAWVESQTEPSPKARRRSKGGRA